MGDNFFEAVAVIVMDQHKRFDHLKEITTREQLVTALMRRAKYSRHCADSTASKIFEGASK